MSINLKSRRKTILKDFKGFDFSSSPLNVSSSRGYLGKNFIFENGVNRKRKGYEELLRIEKIEDGKTIYPQINGIFEFNLNHENFLICYAGKHFYRITFENSNYSYTDITFSSSYEMSKIDTNMLHSRRISMFKNNNAVFFVGAGKLICFKKYGDNYELRLVENDTDTYIPTTTINIQPDGDEEITKQAYEDSNVFNIKRRNTLAVKIPKENEEIIYTLDCGYVNIHKHKVKIDIQKYYPDTQTSNTITLSNLDYDDKLYINQNKEDFYGYISESGKLTFINKNNFLDGTVSITIEFSTNKSTLLDKLNDCQIGIIFGVNGRMDRLFLSKNDIAVNEDYYSESDDFTYFGDSCTSKIGSELSRVMAYCLLSDGSLAIQKEYTNGEAGVYYRNSVYDVNFDKNGNIEYINTYFPTRAGTLGEGVVSSYSICNLGDDKLFLSNNGVYSLTLNGNVTDNRYARERSNYINGKLLKHKNLEEGVAITYKNKYYLAIDDKVYIADPRFKTRSQSTLTDTFDYDWWFWDNVPVRVWQIVSNNLWFGTEDGRICAFDNTYTDKIYQTTQEGDILIDYDNNAIIFNQNLDIKDGDIIKFKSDIYVQAIESKDIIKIENNRVYVDNQKLYLLQNGRRFLVKCASQTLEDLEEYTIKNLDYLNCSFELYLRDNLVQINDKDFSLHFAIKNEKLSLKMDNGKYRVKLLYNDNILTFTKNENSQDLVLSKLLREQNVVCEWYTPMMDFNCNETSKTLLKISVTTEPTTNGKLKFGYLTKDNGYEIDGKGLTYFTFEDLDFANFSFLTTFANSYTIDVKEDFNYIQFYFKSDTATDCVIQNVTLVYKENYFNKGVV